MRTSARGVSGRWTPTQRRGGGAHGGAAEDGALLAGKGGEGEHLLAERLPGVAIGLFRALGLAVAAGVVEEDAVALSEHVEGLGAVGVLVEGGEDAVPDDGEGILLAAVKAVAEGEAVDLGELVCGGHHQGAPFEGCSSSSGGSRRAEGVVHDGTGYVVATAMLDHFGAALDKERKLGVGQASDLLIKGCEDVHDVRHIDMGEPFAVAVVAQTGGEAGRVAVKAGARSVLTAAVRILHDLDPVHEPGCAALGELGPDPVGHVEPARDDKVPLSDVPLGWRAAPGRRKPPKEMPTT